MLPVVDLDLIAQWCSSQWPARFQHEVFCELHVRGTKVTLCETRSLGGGQVDWIHQGYAQLRYRVGSGDWSLHWADRNGRWHPYDPDGAPVVGTCADLLGEIDRDPTAIFKG